MQRRRHTAEEKTKIVLELLRGEHEVNEIAAREGLAPNLIRNWKTEFLENAALVFDKKRDERLKEEQAAKQQESDRRALKLSKIDC